MACQKSTMQRLSEVSAEFSAKVKDLDLSARDILSMERHDLLELLPGDNNLFTRKKLYNIIKEMNEKLLQLQEPPNRLLSSPSPPPPPQPEPQLAAVVGRVYRKKIKIETPEFIMYTDESLRPYIGALRTIPKVLLNQLVQGQCSNLTGACQTLDKPRRPSADEVKQVAEELGVMYPSLGALSELVYEKMRRHMGNKNKPKKKQGKVPQRSRFYKQSREENQQNQQESSTTSSENSSIEESYTAGVQLTNSPNTSFNSDSFVASSPDARIHSSLCQEMEKTKPNQSTVDYYMDALFNYRRDKIKEIKKSPSQILERVKFIKEKFPLFGKDPNQTLLEVKRILGSGNETFLEDVHKRANDIIRGLYYYSLTQLDYSGTNGFKESSIENAFALMLLPSLELLFCDGDSAKRKKKKKDIIMIFTGGDDFKSTLNKRSKDGMPGLVLTPENSFVITGQEVYVTLNSPINAFVAFISLFYLLDIDYPKELEIPLSIVHRYIFSDLHIHATINKDEFDEKWLEVFKYLNPNN